MQGKTAHPQFTVSEVAWTVRRSAEWVRKHADTGEIPHARDSAGRRVFDQSAIDAALQLTGQGRNAA